MWLINLYNPILFAKIEFSNIKVKNGNGIIEKGKFIYNVALF